MFKSILKMYTNKGIVSYSPAWSMGPTVQGGSSVAVVEYDKKVYLLTNSHCVENAAFLQVQLHQGANLYPVKVVWQDPILDLAIVAGITEDIDAFIKSKTEPLAINPHFYPKGTEVNAYGFPSGGNTSAVTKGHISRIEISTIQVSGQAGITVQTSAPINPGNSGGPITAINPATQQEECIGIVMQVSQKLNSVGYFLPACTLLQTIEQYEKYSKLFQHRLIDYITAPTLHFSVQPLKNKALRRSVGLPDLELGEEMMGILITDIPEQSNLRDLLQPGDILTTIDDQPIHADGKVIVPELEDPISLHYLIQRKKYLDEITLGLLRHNGAELESVVVRTRLSNQLGGNSLEHYREVPLKYHIQPSGEMGGFVFICCTLSVMAAYKNSRPSMFKEFNRKNVKEGEVIILQDILKEDATDGYESFVANAGSQCISHRVSRVDGQLISNLYQLQEVMADETQDHVVEFENGVKMVIPPAIHDETYDTRNELQKRYNIAFFTSPSAMKVDFKPVIEQINKLADTYGEVDQIKPSEISPLFTTS